MPLQSLTPFPSQCTNELPYLFSLKGCQAHGIQTGIGISASVEEQGQSIDYNSEWHPHDNMQFPPIALIALLFEQWDRIKKELNKGFAIDLNDSRHDSKFDSPLHMVSFNIAHRNDEDELTNAHYPIYIQDIRIIPPPKNNNWSVNFRVSLAIPNWKHHPAFTFSVQEAQIAWMRNEKKIRDKFDASFQVMPALDIFLGKINLLDKVEIKEGAAYQPIDIKPVDIKPVDIKPVDIKPVDIEPGAAIFKPDEAIYLHMWEIIRNNPDFPPSIKKRLLRPFEKMYKGNQPSGLEDSDRDINPLTLLPDSVCRDIRSRIDILYLATDNEAKCLITLLQKLIYKESNPLILRIYLFALYRACLMSESSDIKLFLYDLTLTEKTTKKITGQSRDPFHEFIQGELCALTTIYQQYKNKIYREPCVHKIQYSDGVKQSCIKHVISPQFFKMIEPEISQHLYCLKLWHALPFDAEICVESFHEEKDVFGDDVFVISIRIDNKFEHDINIAYDSVFRAKLKKLLIKEQGLLLGDRVPRNERTKNRFFCKTVELLREKCLKISHPLSVFIERFINLDHMQYFSYDELRVLLFHAIVGAFMYTAPEKRVGEHDNLKLFITRILNTELADIFDEDFILTQLKQLTLNPQVEPIDDVHLKKAIFLKMLLEMNSNRFAFAECQAIKDQLPTYIERASDKERAPEERAKAEAVVNLFRYKEPGSVPSSGKTLRDVATTGYQLVRDFLTPTWVSDEARKPGVLYAEAYFHVNEKKHQEDEYTDTLYRLLSEYITDNDNEVKGMGLLLFPLLEGEWYKPNADDRRQYLMRFIVFQMVNKWLLESDSFKVFIQNKMRKDLLKTFSTQFEEVKKQVTKQYIIPTFFESKQEEQDVASSKSAPGTELPSLPVDLPKKRKMDKRIPLIKNPGEDPDKLLQALIESPQSPMPPSSPQPPAVVPEPEKMSYEPQNTQVFKELEAEYEKLAESLESAYRDFITALESSIPVIKDHFLVQYSNPDHEFPNRLFLIGREADVAIKNARLIIKYAETYLQSAFLGYANSNHLFKFDLSKDGPRARFDKTKDEIDNVAKKFNEYCLKIQAMKKTCEAGEDKIRALHEDKKQAEEEFEKALKQALQDCLPQLSSWCITLAKQRAMYPEIITLSDLDILYVFAAKYVGEPIELTRPSRSDFPNCYPTQTLLVHFITSQHRMTKPSQKLNKMIWIESLYNEYETLTIENAPSRIMSHLERFAQAPDCPSQFINMYNKFKALRDAIPDVEAGKQAILASYGSEPVNESSVAILQTTLYNCSQQTEQPGDTCPPLNPLALPSQSQAM